MIIENHDIAGDQAVMPGNCELAVEARFILSAMQAAGPREMERRSACRVPYRVEARLQLVADGPYDVPRLVYTRDITPKSVGFISPDPVPLGSAGTLHLPNPGGGIDTIACSVIRCREIIHGWFEGAVAFREGNSSRP